MKIKKQTLQKISTFGIVVTFILLVYFIGFKESSKNYDSFADCLTENKAVMYGTYWCGYCNAQKREFKDSIEKINYVECSDEKDKCIKEDIQSFPTWIINGKKYEGKQSLSKLSTLTGCELKEG